VNWLRWTKLESKTVFASPFVSVREDVFETAAKKRVSYWSVEVRHWVMIVAFTPQNELVLVRQYRPSPDEVLLELPAGALEKGEGAVAIDARLAIN